MSESDANSWWMPHPANGNEAYQLYLDGLFFSDQPPRLNVDKLLPFEAGLVRAAGQDLYNDELRARGKPDQIADYPPPAAFDHFARQNRLTLAGLHVTAALLEGRHDGRLPTGMDQRRMEMLGREVAVENFGSEPRTGLDLPPLVWSLVVGYGAPSLISNARVRLAERFTDSVKAHDSAVRAEPLPPIVRDMHAELLRDSTAQAIGQTALRFAHAHQAGQRTRPHLPQLLKGAPWMRGERRPDDIMTPTRQSALHYGEMTHFTTDELAVSLQANLSTFEFSQNLASYYQLAECWAVLVERALLPRGTGLSTEAQAVLRAYRAQVAPVLQRHLQDPQIQTALSSTRQPIALVRLVADAANKHVAKLSGVQVNPEALSALDVALLQKYGVSALNLAREDDYRRAIREGFIARALGATYDQQLLQHRLYRFRDATPNKYAGSLPLRLRTLWQNGYPKE